MSFVKPLHFIRTGVPNRMIYSGKKPEITKIKKSKTITEQLSEEPVLQKPDQDRGIMSHILEGIQVAAPPNPVTNWTWSQVSSAVRDYRFTDAFRVIYNIKVLNKVIVSQNYSPVREERLGSDLAAAHFLLDLGAHVRFSGHDDYITSNSILSNKLPLHYDSSYKLEAIKLAKAEIFDNGYKSLRNLLHVKHFDASSSDFFNDAQLDRVFCQFGTTLESIDISNCSKLSSSGLTCLGRFRKLKHLKVEGLEYVKNLEFICLLLMESNANLNIEGVHYALENEEEADRIEDNDDTDAKKIYFEH